MPIQFEWTTFSESASTRYSTSVEAGLAENLPEADNLLSFLATAQELLVELLPMTWTRQVIGFGGTSKLNDSYGNPQTSFAFKRVDDETKHSTPHNVIFRALTNEILSLGDQYIRNHPNIVQLQGICWDISSQNDEAWPVLVFEKAHLGDLYRFSCSPIGREMNFEQRLFLCMDIEAALMDMHTMNMVHGDMKPQNVLVFKENGNEYRARVIDFGYAARYADEEHRIKLPISLPWNAPEHDRLGREWTLSQAKKVDIFSFGMTCFWFLFESFISGTLSESRNGNLALAEETSLVTLSRIKRQLRGLTRLLIAEHRELREYKAAALETFFGITLNEDPAERQFGLRRLLNELPPQREATGGINPIQEPICSLLTESFKLESSLFDLYRCDYRIRKHITRCLIEQYQTYPRLGLQVALCHELGFGVSRDAAKATEILERSGLDIGSIHDTLKALLARSGRPNSRTGDATIQDMSYLGHVDWANFAQSYLQYSRLEEAEAQLRQEKADLEVMFGSASFIVSTLVSSLCEIYFIQGRWKEVERLCLKEIEACKVAEGDFESLERGYMSRLCRAYQQQGQYQAAEEIGVELVERCEYIWGEESPITLREMNHLALVYSDQGQWDDAVELSLRILEEQKRQLGECHPSTLLTMNNLAVSYWQQGHWTRSLELHTQVLNAEKHALRDDHPSVLMSMSNIVLNHAQCGRWSMADELNTVVLDGRQRILGPEHPDTLVSIGNRAWIYTEQGRLDDAAELELQLTETQKRVIGPEHPDRLKTMANLATTRWAQCRYDEAEYLTVQVLESRRRVLGPEHPDTLVSLSDMASIHWIRDRYDECEALEVETLHARKETLGDDHHETLISISNLAHTYSSKGELDRAQVLFEQVLESRKRVLGDEHPDTMSSMFDLASLFRKQNKESEASELSKQCLKLRTHVLGETHPDTLKSISSIRGSEG